MVADMVLQVAKTSLTASMLIAALLLLMPLLRKRYPAKWRYIAWLVIAVRLMVPAGFSIPEAPIRLSIPQQKALATVTPPSSEHPYLQMDVLSHADTAATWDFEEFSDLSNEPGKPAIAVTPLEIIGLIWLFGTVAFLLFQIEAYQLFLLKLRKPVAGEIPQSVKEALWRLGVEMGVCKLPEAVITNAVEAPALIGIIRPRLLLPHVDYTEDELYFILRHELAHYRRRDMWYKLVLMLANALHWFNPLVYLMVAQAGKDVELACDDEVARELDQDGRVRYGDTILTALPRKRRREPMFSTHFGSTKKNVKGRLRNLFDTTLKRRGIAALCAVAVCSVTVTGAVTVGYATAKSEPDPAVAGEQSLSIPYTFSVASIEPGEVVCIGKVELGPDISYTATLLVESGSNPMMALYDSPNATRHDGIGWKLYFGGGSQIYFSSEKNATYYVYVGCKPDGIRLTNVTGRLIPHESGSNYAFPGTPPLSQTSIFARANSGTWASATEIGGNSYQAQLDGKIRWLDAVYAEHKTPFVISETIPENESYHMAGIGYLYNTSEVYRNMSQMKDGSFQLTDGGSFSCSGMPSGRVYDRTAVMVDSAADLTIDMEYELSEGQMAIWLVNPSGKQVYLGGLVKSYNGSYTVQGEKGIWSVITVSEAANGAVSGTSRIVLKTTESITQPEATSSGNAVGTSQSGEDIVFQLHNNNGQKSITQSGSFEVKSGQKLFLIADSNIKGGSVDFFLFSPSYEQQRITIGGSATTKTIEMTAGTWAYNCTGFFDSGDITITGKISSDEHKSSSVKSVTENYDEEGIRIMDNSGTWGESINRLLPYMSPAGVEKVVGIYLERHLFPGITTSQGARQVAATIEPALKYMTKEAGESANSRISAYYSN